MNETRINNKLKISVWLTVASCALIVPAQILWNIGLKQYNKEAN